MAVAGAVSGDSVRFGPPQPLFHTTANLDGGFLTRAECDDTNDGQRVIVSEPRGNPAADAGPISVLVNWTAALRRDTKK